MEPGVTRAVLYLDTSALVKLYVEEEFSELVERAVERANEIAVSNVSYLEARSAFALLRQDEELRSEEDLRRVVARLDEDWSHYTVYDADQEVLRAAADLAERRSRDRLRFCDALHLATARRAAGGGPGSPGGVEMLAFDQKLALAARQEMPLYFDPSSERTAEGL